MTREIQLEDAATDDGMVMNCLSDQTLQCAQCGRQLPGCDEDWEACCDSPEILYRALKVGRIRGIVAILGCTDSFSPNHPVSVDLVCDLVRRDLLVIVSGCISSELKDAGLMDTVSRESTAGGLKEFCDFLDIAPVLFAGDTSDTSDMETLFNALVDQAGKESNKLPVVLVATTCSDKHNAMLNTFDSIAELETDPVKTADRIDLRIHDKRIGLKWCDQFHCKIHS